MKTLLVEGTGMRVVLETEPTYTIQWVRERVGDATGVPAERLVLFHCSKLLQDHQTLSELPVTACLIVRASLSLSGGMIDPVLRRLALTTVVCLICRKCYCRNGLERTTCHKCGWPDLRGKKKNSKEMRRLQASLIRE